MRPAIFQIVTCRADDDSCLLDCQDIDDALHARVLPNGNIEAGVRKSFFFKNNLVDDASQKKNTQILLMSLISSIQTLRWIAKQHQEEQQSIL